MRQAEKVSREKLKESTDKVRRTEGPDEPGNVALRHSTSLGRRASQSATSVGPSPSSIASASRVRAHASTAPPRGSLVFSAAFEGGNLGVVKPASSSEWEIWLRPDTMAPRHRLWFHFQARRLRASSGGRKVLQSFSLSSCRQASPRPSLLVISMSKHM